MDLLIKNGKIVSAAAAYTADVAVKGEKIVQVGIGIEPAPGAKVVDATGKLVLPGAIDAHTHLAMPFGGTVSADDYEAGTRAAACGGTTTVFDFALQDFGERMEDTVKRREEICAPQATVDYAFHVGVKDAEGNLLDSLETCVEYGVPSFKVFMVYDFGVTDGVFYRVLERSKDIGALIAVHAENNEMVNMFVKRFLAEGKTSAWHHYLSRPEFVEGEADERAIAWAKSLNAPLYIVHLANKQGMDAVTRARNEGYPVFAETCPQYLHFTNEVYKRENGRNWVCSPPIKGEASRDALWAGLLRGDIATVATDHCPFLQAEKDWGLHDFTKIPNGCAGIENMYPYMLSEANKGRLSYSKVVEVCATAPAKIFGLSDQKGAIRPGLDADIVLYDPQKNFTIENALMHGAGDHTVWEGVQLKGYPAATYSRGALVYQDGKFLGKKGAGRFVKCKPIRITGPDISNIK
ncbi:MAG: dihydropyrimidinase [Clostridiales Family XIII bacterium]|jgi:dihydropyrimidinase|nr:dihydropyrimidinase [Clostridiales Family XIII bacterium]